MKKLRRLLTRRLFELVELFVNKLVIYTACGYDTGLYFLMLPFNSRYLEKYSVDLFMWNQSMLPTTSVSRLVALSRSVFSTNDKNLGWIDRRLVLAELTL